MHYVFLDEIQMMNSNFTDLINGLLHIENLDIYVTGSNSKFLSSDILTEFRGRGDVYIHYLLQNFVLPMIIRTRLGRIIILMGDCH